MLNKLRLDQTKNYEKAIAANEIAQMLVAFIQGREHSLCIGAEQGGIDKWDDFVIVTSDGTYKHIQAKRQQTDFSASSCKCIRDRDQNGNLRPLSPLDKTMQSLANWVQHNDLNTASPKRHFVIELPDNTTHIKKEIQVRHFHTLCQNHICSVTIAQGLEALARSDKSTKNCFNWLTTWCDFSDWDHILKALRLLEIKQSGNPNDIEERTETTLSHVFWQPIEVRKKIISYIDENSTYTGAISPRPLLKQLKDYLLPGIATWTQYQKNNSKWKISGIHDLDFNEIERASFVVPSLWSNDRARHLKFDVPVDDTTKLSKSIVHLALHLQGQVNAHCTNSSCWKQKIETLIGGTLGITCSNCNTLCICENPTSFSVSDFKELCTRQEFDTEADNIRQEMVKVTWNLIVQELEQKLDDMQTSDLRDSIEACWKSWKSTLEQDPSEQENLFSRMLHAQAEGNDISAELRVGPKTISLIADGIFLLLIVSIGLSDTNADWKSIGEKLSVNTIGLNYWSDPSNSPRKVRDLNDEGIGILIGKEPYDVLILSKTHVSSSEIFEVTLASDVSDNNNLTNPHRPKLLVTNDLRFKTLIKKGNKSKLRSYLTEALEKRLTSLKQSIDEVL